MCQHIAIVDKFLAPVLLFSWNNPAPLVVFFCPAITGSQGACIFSEVIKSSAQQPASDSLLRDVASKFADHDQSNARFAMIVKLRSKMYPCRSTRDKLKSAESRGQRRKRKRKIA